MIILDTHAWIWWLSAPERLSKSAAREIRSAKRVGVSAISCMEVATLAARGRIELDRDPLDWMLAALELPRVELLPLSPAVAVRSATLDPDFHGDPADRILVASTLLESARLVTKDGKIREYLKSESIW